MIHASSIKDSSIPPLTGSEQRPRPRIGLSTDLYFPPLALLLEALKKGPSPEYLEIFRGRTEDLTRARTEIPREIPLAYHGDCLWYTQADFLDNPAYRSEVGRAVRHMDALEAPWMIHECAQKMMEGFAFGLYAPPLLTEEGATAARNGALFLQEALGERQLLVETPPFPPHPAGRMDLGEFFWRITQDTSMGIGLDLGHCMTYLALSRRNPTPASLMDWLRHSFPLERVVEIHVGGLAQRILGEETILVDDHTHPVPDLLFDSLEAVLDSLDLPSLAGVALEVDNKAIPLIIREFARFFDIVERKGRPVVPGARLGPRRLPSPLTPVEERTLREGYASLGRDMVENLASPYRRHLYPEEIWTFGGAMPDLFPETLSLLSVMGLDARSSFIAFFNRDPSSLLQSMDFLEVKIIRALAWIKELADGRGEAFSTILRTAEREASLLLSAQHQFNGDSL